jgi:hypothetical protein
MTKRLAVALSVAFGLGVSTPLVFALYFGGEAVAQAGLRLAAIEQGFALAARHWQFEATPEHEMTVARADVAPSAPARKPRK